MARRTTGNGRGAKPFSPLRGLPCSLPEGLWRLFMVFLVQVRLLFRTGTAAHGERKLKKGSDLISFAV